MKKIIYSLLLLLLFSCGGAEENSKLVFKTFERISNPTNLTSAQVGGELMLSYAFNIYSYKNYIIVYADDSKSFFHIFDKESGEEIATGGRKGRSSSELPQYLLGVTIVGNKLYASTITNEVKVYNLDEIVAGGSDGYIETIKHNESAAVKLFYPIGESKSLLFSGGSMLRGDERERFILKEGDSTLYRYNKTIPIIDDTDERNYTFWSTFVSNSLNPKGNKLVSATRYGAILEIFNIDAKHNKIENCFTKTFYQPAFIYERKTFEGGGIGITMGPTEESLLGFSDIATTDKYIYTLYIGEMHNEKKDAPKPNLAIFNWKGEYVTEFELDKKVNRIAVSEDGEMLYGYTVDEDGVNYLVSYNLKDLI